MKLIDSNGNTHANRHVGSAIAGLQIKEIRLNQADIKALLDVQHSFPERVTELLNNWFIRFGPNQ